MKEARKKRLLFVCNGNISRSRTAEDLFQNSREYEAKSAGIEPQARIHIDQKLIDWADVVFVMDERVDRQLSYLKKNFLLNGKPLHNLGVENHYRRGELKLVKLIKERLSEHGVELK